MKDERLALLLDGGFVKKRLADKLKRFPPAEEVARWTGELLSHADLVESRLLRTMATPDRRHELLVHADRVLG